MSWYVLQQHVCDSVLFIPSSEEGNVGSGEAFAAAAGHGDTVTTERNL